jgi:antitoxin (DNA-binding transcriptional repressor) of toxin-antitoxin stability system
VEAAMHTISATEFKATCLELLDKVNRGEIDELAITKRGVTVAILRRPRVTREEAEAIFGCMKGTLGIPDDLDLTAPVFDPDDILSEKGIPYIGDNGPVYADE